MEPEISTRCQQCGAAVRPHTLFCPECGQPADNPASQVHADNHRPAPTVQFRAEDGDGNPPGTPVKDNPDEAPAVDEPESEKPAIDEPKIDEPKVEEPHEESDPDASAAEAADAKKDVLTEHLAKLKETAETPPVVIVDNSKRKSLKRRSSSSSLTTGKKSSKGRLIWSRFPSLRRSDEPRPGMIEPGLRFLIVAGVLVIFALVAYYFSKFLR